MTHSEPRYATYVVVNAHTGDVHSVHLDRRAARAAKAAAGDHALRVRGGDRRIVTRASLLERLVGAVTGKKAVA